MEKLGYFKIGFTIFLLATTLWFSFYMVDALCNLYVTPDASEAYSPSFSISESLKLMTSGVLNFLLRLTFFLIWLSTLIIWIEWLWKKRKELK